ncbi:MAG: ArnT family glycosyltransferase [Candidatus Limnocylindrales bacterium]
MKPSIDRRELLGLGAILVLAALARFIGLPARGTWDADQGHDMLVLLGLVRDGTIPLLGPPTSIGEFHHGAIYYYLLAPAAFLSGADPSAVVAEIALAGVAAVGVTWWLARSIGGSVAGFVAALVMAISLSAIDESTFLWNPNLIALSSAVALAGAWRARTTDRARWWLVAALGVLVTMHLHVLGIGLLPPVVALLVVSYRATPAGLERTRLRWVGAAGLAIILAGYVPLFIHELTHDFAESRAALAFIASGGTGVSLSLPVRLLFVGLRIVAWPLTGLLTSGLVIGVLAAIMVVVGLGWRASQAPVHERTAARWLVATLLFGWTVLTFGAAGLSTVTPLPVDHYHAFLDPVVFIALGIEVAAIWRLANPTALDPATAAQVAEPIPSTAARAARMSVVAGLGVLIAWNVAHWPPVTAADGGWPGARAAADRIEADIGDRTTHLIGLPRFKSTEAYGFPLERDGRTVVESIPQGAQRDPVRQIPDPAASVVVICDSLFVRDCGGSAEAGALAGIWPEAVPVHLVDRWEPTSGRTISVYLPNS